MPENGDIISAGLFPLLIAAAVIPFFVHLVISSLLGLYREKDFRQKGAVAAVLIGLAPLALVFVVLGSGGQEGSNRFWAGIYLLGVYLLFGYVYFHIFNMSETARRIRILSRGHRDGKVIKDELNRDYTRREMVETRIARLLALGEIRRRDSRYVGGRMFLLWPARAVFGFRRLLFPERPIPDGQVPGQRPDG